eukprot:TRINITY_DN6843_c0_g1_i1.p1 TRINITY_DN6843_c0_g1~~TRINITY_DN6843_c0_g1_i1.p1  ORF type:complete len:111 (+),score=15.02 TRINITY_DN6843_c0_g1_i1:82-414(+)
MEKRQSRNHHLKGVSGVVCIVGAMDALARGLAVDLAPIRVNTVCPGFVSTEMWEAMPTEARTQFFKEQGSKLLTQKIGTPEEVAQSYIYLMQSTYVTGQTIVTDGGLTLQ